MHMQLMKTLAKNLKTADPKQRTTNLFTTTNYNCQTPTKWLMHDITCRIKELLLYWSVSLQCTRRLHTLLHACRCGSGIKEIRQDVTKPRSLCSRAAVEDSTRHKNINSRCSIRRLWCCRARQFNAAFLFFRFRRRIKRFIYVLFIGSIVHCRGIRISPNFNPKRCRRAT